MHLHISIHFIKNLIKQVNTKYVRTFTASVTTVPVPFTQMLSHTDPTLLLLLLLFVYIPIPAT